METTLRKRLSHIRTIVTVATLASALTYMSLIVPGRAIAPCGNLGTPMYCTVPAYGFPLPFLADGHATSPVGSVARDPLSILIGMDQILWPRPWLAVGFWLLVSVAVLVCLSRRRGRRHW